MNPEPILDDISEQEMAAAIRTLQGLGYTYHGGEQWKPPTGEKPDFAAIDARRGAYERVAAYLAQYRKMGGLDPEFIHAVNGWDLVVNDLQILLDFTKDHP